MFLRASLLRLGTPINWPYTIHFGNIRIKMYGTKEFDISNETKSEREYIEMKSEVGGEIIIT